MKKLKTIRPKGFSESSAEKFKLRKSSRAVVFDHDNKIALLYVGRLKYHKLPGGGIKEGEDAILALKRECLEEIGCRIKIIKDLGLIIEYRDKFKIKQKSYGYLAKVMSGKKAPAFTKKEIENKFKIKWVDLEKAVKLLESDKPTDYAGRFINDRDLIYLKEAKKLI